LLLDDDPFMLKLLVRMLAQLGFTQVVGYDSGQEDFGRAVATDGGDVIVGGYWRDTTGEQVVTDWQILRYDARGNLVWRRNYDSGNQDWLSDVMVDGSRNIIAVGSATSDSSDTIRALIVKFSPRGEVAWDNLFTCGLACQGYALCPGPNDGIFVCGSTFAGSDSSDLDILLAEFDADGDLVKQETLDFGADESGQDIALDRQGNLLIVGEQVPLAGDADSVSTADLLILKVNRAGKVIWRRLYDSGDDDLAGSITVDSIGNSHVAVTSRGDEGTNMRLLEYDPQGRIVQDKPYLDQRNTACTAIALDPTGAIIGVGGTGPDTAQRYLAFKYDRNWFSSILNPQHYHHGVNDLTFDVALDDAGNVIITGVSDPGTDPDILTIKLGNPRSEK
jgi:hypothetical protein